MADIARDKALQHGAAVAGATRTEAASPKSDEISAHRAKTRSWDYIWRSGVAGGVAGCAVSYCSQTPNSLYGLCKKKYSQSVYTRSCSLIALTTGQNHCGAP